MHQLEVLQSSPTCTLYIYSHVVPIRPQVCLLRCKTSCLFQQLLADSKVDLPHHGKPQGLTRNRVELT